MIKLGTLTPGLRSGRALLVLLAATAALAGGELALAPASAPALIAEKCQPNEPGLCGLPDEGVPGGDSGEGWTQPGEIIEIVDTKPPPEPPPVKTPPVDLGPLFGDKLGSGQGNASSGPGGPSDPDLVFTRELGCGAQLRAFGEAAAAEQNAPAAEKEAKDKAADEAHVRYQACRSADSVMLAPPAPIGDCDQIARERNASTNAGQDLYATAKSFEVSSCKARVAWEDGFLECQHRRRLRSCWSKLGGLRQTLLRRFEAEYVWLNSHGWRLEFRNGDPWWKWVGAGR